MRFLFWYTKACAALFFFMVFLVFSARPTSKIVKVVFEKYADVAKCKNCDFYGNDLTWYWSSGFDNCHHLCQWYGSSCTHFVYSGAQGKCYLKSGTIYTFAAFPIRDRELDAGIMCSLLQTEECRKIIHHSQWIPKFYVGPPAKFMHSTGCYFNEEYAIASFYNASQEQCTGECRRNPSCTHYNFYFGYCDMFQGAVEYDDVLKCEAPHCHCGVDCLANTATKICMKSGDFEYSIIQQPIKAPIAYQEYTRDIDDGIRQKAIEYNPPKSMTGI